MKRLMLSFLVAASLALTACGGGPKVVVVRQATPSPITTSTHFVVMGAELAPDIRIGGAKSEAEWMADKKPETREHWEGDKAAMRDEFVKGFIEAKEGLLVDNTAGEGTVTVRARYTQYEPGYNVVVSASYAILEAEVVFLDAAGNVIDEIRITAKDPVGYGGTGVSARNCARKIGEAAAKYMRKRLSK